MLFFRLFLHILERPLSTSLGAPRRKGATSRGGAGVGPRETGKREERGVLLVVLTRKGLRRRVASGIVNFIGSISANLV